MQKEILAAHPSFRLRVHAIWFNAVITDQRARWPSEALTDRRVSHYWDEGKVLGRWYAARWVPAGAVGGEEGGAGSRDRLLWDAFFLYAPDAVSMRDDERVIAWGGTVVERSGDLRRAVDSLATAAGGGP